MLVNRVQHAEMSENKPACRMTFGAGSSLNFELETEMPKHCLAIPINI
jgi:hypothetical protein